MDDFVQDAIPEGYISLKDAWKRFSNWGSRPHDPEYGELLTPFIEGELEAFFRHPGSAENLYLPKDGWKESFFLERVFIFEVINEGGSDHWKGCTGRTPFLKRSELDSWIGKYYIAAQKLRDSLNMKYDPMQETAWTLSMTVAWIVWRDPVYVQGQMDDFRVEYGERPASTVYMAINEAIYLEAETDGEDEKEISVGSAKSNLWRALSDGAVVATGVDVNGDIVEIPARNWAYLELSHTSSNEDCVINKDKSLEPEYSKLKFQPSQIQNIWKAKPIERPETSGLFAFDHEAEEWSLADAAIWVGCEGKELSHEEVAQNQLDDKGSIELFAYMFQNPDKLKASGLTREQIREDIPYVYWERASTDPELEGRHFVSFIDVAIKTEWGGVLTPYNRDDLFWFDIKISVRALKSVFPFWGSAARDNIKQLTVTTQNYAETKNEQRAKSLGNAKIWIVKEFIKSQDKNPYGTMKLFEKEVSKKFQLSDNFARQAIKLAQPIIEEKGYIFSWRSPGRRTS